ncbi:glycosyltransferase [Crenobacter cavernae]|uniref:Glycosyltransferase n=1 Tax=Crenobacter cavernae TaxID=2290923 RepID=A0ABY0FBN2_9NEIS|nr:glycosyltransferase [Crenobacter cavernae]RXZ43461.1 glycosyltransferase [Crenobacter cavernae]
MTCNNTLRHVLFLIPSLRGGGAERVIVTLVRHLDRSRFKVILAVIDMREAAYRQDIPNDIELIDLNCARVRYAMPKIVRLIWRRRPDVVFSTLGHLNLALAMIRPILPGGVRYIARETTIVSEGLKRYSHPHWWVWAYRKFYNRFDKIICQSHYMRDDLLCHFNQSVEKAVVIHNPIDIERIHPLMMEPLETELTGKEAVNLVAVGRLSHEKGFDLLIEALALCANTKFRLTILGEGPLRSELEQMARDKGVMQQVHFAGFQKNPYPFIAQADAFVMSSRYEGFPNVVLEALACCTPVVALPAPGGVREILNEVAGCVLAKALTPQALALALQEITPGSRLSEGGVRPYSIERIVNRYAVELTCDADI